VRASLPGNAHVPESDATTALGYYDVVRRAFARAAARAGLVEQRLEIAGAGVRLHIAGPGLAPVLEPALSPMLHPGHDRQDPGPNRQDAVIELWDGASTGVGIPDPPWRRRDVIARGDVRSLYGGRLRAQVYLGDEILTMWDCTNRRGIMWVPDARRLPYWVRAAPMRNMLHWAIAGEARHMVHAGAVGDEQSGALLVGPNGSGKSTTALACLDDGLGYVADDCVLAQIAPAPRASALYGTAKLTASGLRLLPRLARCTVTSAEPKYVVEVARVRPELLRASAAISAILLTRVTPGRLELRPVGPAEALRALAPSTILQHPHESAGGLAVMSALVRQVPAFVLDLGSDIGAVAPTIRTLLEAQR
jgi:hypothetical protein